MQKLILILSLLLSASMAYGQDTSSEAYSEGIGLLEAHEYDQAIKCFDIAYEAAPAKSQDRSRAMWGKGMALYSQAQDMDCQMDYQGAYTKYAEAMKCFRRVSSHKDVMDCAYSMGRLNFYHFEYYNLALEQFAYAYEIAQSLNLADKQADILIYIIKLNKKLHRQDAAAIYGIRLDSLLSKGLSPKTALTKMVEQGNNALDNFNYDVAILFYEKALAFASSPPDELKPLDGLINAFCQKKDYANALKYSGRLIACWQQKFSDDPKLRLLPFLSHGIIQVKAGDIAGAYESLDSIQKSLQYVSSPLEQSQAYTNKGGIYINLKEWAKAAECLQMADSLLCQSDRSIAVNEQLRILMPLYASALYRMGDLEGSYGMFARNLKLSSDAYGEYSMEYARALCMLANVEGYLGYLDDGMKHYIKAWETTRDIAAVDLMLLPSNARGTYWDDVNSLMWDMAPYALAAGCQEDDFTAAAFEALMFSKGLLLLLEKSTKKQIQAYDDDQLLDDFTALANLRNEIEKQRSLCNGEEIMRLYGQMQELDRRLSVGMNAAGISPVVGLKSADVVLSALSDKEVLVDFADFVKEDGSHVYAAFVLRHGMRAPRIIKVFEQSALDSLLAENGGKYSDLYLDYNQEEIYGIVWEPLLSYLEGVETIYIVPTGILNQIAIESIRLPSGEYVDDAYSVVRLSNSKELLSHNSRLANRGDMSARLYGGLEYDVAPDDMAIAAKITAIEPLYATRGGTERLNATIGFDKLKESGPEVIEIADILSQSDIQVDRFMDKQGTEESFMDMSGHSPDILHLSTHGFYYSAENVPAWSSLNGYDNPMYLTGLALSGGNAEYLKRDIPDGVMGGLLTSSDITALDLSHTQLVVLSGCETGLGDTTNEGVYGLQRAFKKAGVATLVMSLWSVSDVATKLFMTTFNRELTLNNLDKRAAFRNAKAAVRTKYENPYYWAAFVMID